MTADDPNRLPQRTTPTWEIELLISGALVFALLRMPEWLDLLLLRWLPFIDEHFRGGVFIVAVYLRTAMLVLAGAFVVHLMLRAYWVALVGVHSVYPAGPVWERIRQGPLSLKWLKQNWRPLPLRIDASDNAASLVFATGVGMGALMLALALTIGLLMLVSGMLSRWRVLDLQAQDWLLVLIVVLMGPTLLATVIDRVWGTRIDPQGRFGRLLDLMLALQRWLPGFQAATALLLTVVSNLVQRGASLLVALGIVVAINLNAFNMPVLSKTLSPAVLSPDGHSPWLSRPEHYRDQRRGMDRFSLVPSIDSREAGDEALQLFVPLRADRHRAAVRAACPELEWAQLPDRQAELARQQSLLHCLGQLLRPGLDGAPWSGEGPIFSSDPLSGQEVLLWRLPVKSLA